MSLVYCVDFGSTFTKAALVDVGTGALVGTGQPPHDHRHRRARRLGRDPCRARAARPDGADVPVLACSSAGGGLRIAVVGNEELVTVRGRPSGRAVERRSGRARVLRRGRPCRPARRGARRRPAGRWHRRRQRRGPPRQCRSARGVPLVRTGCAWQATSMPSTRSARPSTPPVCRMSWPPTSCREIGVLAPDGARAAIREMFLSHVIGGKHLSRAHGLHRDGQRCHTGRRADRRRARRRWAGTGAARCGRRCRRRCRGSDDRRALGRRGRPGGVGSGPRGGRDRAGQPDRRGRSRDALERSPDRRGRS